MRSTRVGLVVVGAVALAVTAAPATAGAGGGGGSGCLAFADAGTDATEVVLRDFCLEPVGATATAGVTITVTNLGAASHTYTAVDGSFDTGVLDPGASTTVELPDTVGTLPVYCTLHSPPDGAGMAGTVNLVAAETTETAGGAGVPTAALLTGVAAGGLGGAALRRRRPAAVADPVDG